MKNVNEMNKAELRAACKEVGVKGYGNMTNDQMRQAITATQSPVVSEEDQALIKECGHANCPHCGVHLSNGMWDVDSLVRDKLSSKLGDYASDAEEINQEAKFSFWCMACDEYFGEARVPMNLETKKVVAVGTGIKIEKDREERNGLKRPSVGGVCRQVWDWCDAFLAANGKAPKPSDLKNSGFNWNQNNAVAELYRWKKFVA